jgi:hypothetical protein
MNQHNRINLKNVGLIQTICGGLLLGIPVISLAAAAQTDVTNPCPSIFYEEPFSSRVAAPQGCPANDFTRMGGQDTTPRTPVVIPDPAQQGQSTSPSTPPLPETVQNAIATVIPTNGTVNVRLINNTNVLITYQALGYTERRILAPEAEYTMLDLPAPVTITAERQDDGFLTAMPMSSRQQGLLEVALDEDYTTRDNAAGTLRIEEDGQVYWY